MKKKLLLLLLFNLLFGFFLSSKNIDSDINFYQQDFKVSAKSLHSDTIKKQKKNSRSFKNSRILAVLPSPLITAGSSCSDGINPVQVNVYAFGVNGNETIEWFTSQSSGIPIYTGSVYSPSISATRTYYVQSRSGGDTSIRIPVVASVYIVPPAVFLTVSPDNSMSSPLCIGTSVTFTATGGGDLFEFSVDGVVKQVMSTNKIFVTNDLTDGQVVRVRTRYAVNFDGNVTEKAWGTASLEDNFLSVPLSSTASTGYINSLKISSTEDKLIFGILGKSLSNRRILLFLDTKTGGFNISNYGDEAGSIPTVNAFNYFNNNPSTFDSYFQADYCLAIGTDSGETNYSADIIELRTGTSIKTNLGIAATGIPSSVMGVNKNNAGIKDYSLGFEVEILKSLLGYTTGDIKFFAMTLADQDELNYLVTNSFLSPERTSNLDYGNGAVDYNLKDPNPVVVAASALTPCYSEANITMSFAEKPTVATVGGNQSKCILTSDSLGGNTPSVGTGSWSKKSGPGTVAFSNSTNGSSTASVSVEGVYVFTWTITNGQCTPSSADISVEYNVTPSPVIDAITQPTCSDNSGSVLLRGLPSVGTWIITPSSGSPVSGSGSTYLFGNLLASTSYTFTVTGLNNCTSVPSSPVSINAIPTPPVSPTTASVIQPTCATPSGSISITTQTGVEYSLNGTTYQSSNTFSGLAPNNYTLYVRNTADNTCVTPSSGAVTINAIKVILTPTAAKVVQPTCATPTGSISITTQSGVEYSLNGTTYQSSNAFSGLVPNNYTLYVRNTADNTCLKSSATMITINAVPTPPVAATTASVVQPTCAIPSGTITIAPQSGVEYSLNGTTYQASNTFTGLAPNNYILYVRNSADNTCSVQSTGSVTVNPLPLLPSTPTLVRVTQPTCFVPSGSIEIATQANVQYSIGSGYQNSAVFNNLAPGKYTMSVRFINSIACITLGSETTINAIPPQIQFETIADCENKEYTLTANPLLRSYDPNNVSYQWKDKAGNLVGTNSNVLNVTDVIASNPSGQVVFPVTYTLTVTSLNTGCETSSDVIVESVYCNMQKGISPDGNGSNDFFDLRLMDVKKLEIFNRYGIKVYSQNNYSDQWNGQSSKGEDLPSATYYYVIEFNSGEPKTGWIYLIREKQ